MSINTSDPSQKIDENAIAQEWWVQRWIDLLNTYRFKKRLERGRIYAREGNILHMEFRNGKVHATVQGTAPEPYKLTISIERFSDEDWQFVIASMAAKAIYSAKLLAGTMPDDIETVFTSNGLSLFPFTLLDVRSRCSCPDPKNPCKHIAAVYYQLGDFFREDPFVLFQLRGRTKTEILQTIRLQRSNTANPETDQMLKEDQETTQKSTTVNAAETTLEGTNITTPSTNHLNNFWQYEKSLDPSLVVITPPTNSQTILDLLGKLPLAPNDAQTIRQYLDTTYQSVSQQAMITALNRT
ncbi:MAG: SWIM zinc finger family protein [Leptolyngbyaceae bacterium]|nr:SWIM zinc finger family protein [Leptolyngbyaceae bacterium]